MNLLEIVFDVMKRKDWLDDVNFINNSKEYTCIQDYYNIVKNQKVLIVRDDKNSRYSILYIYNDDIEFSQLLYNENISLSDFFELSRTLKVEKLLKEFNNGEVE